MAVGSHDRPARGRARPLVTAPEGPGASETPAHRSHAKKFIAIADMVLNPSDRPGVYATPTTRSGRGNRQASAFALATSLRPSQLGCRTGDGASQLRNSAAEIRRQAERAIQLSSSGQGSTKMLDARPRVARARCSRHCGCGGGRRSRWGNADERVGRRRDLVRP
jgi:hypothetical protein